MGLLDELRKLTKPYSDDDYDDFGDELPEEPRETKIHVNSSTRRSYASPERRSSYSDTSTERRSAYSEFTSRVSAPQGRDKIVNLNSASSQPFSNPQIMLVKPERFEKAAEIADQLRDGNSVLLNLEQVDKPTARRLIDFLSGVVYAIDGKVQKVAASTYVLTPQSVNVMGSIIDELGNDVFNGRDTFN